MGKFSDKTEAVSIISGAMASAAALAAPSGVMGVLASIGIGSPLEVTATASAPILATVSAVISVVSASIWLVEKIIEKIKQQRGPQATDSPSAPA
ncbi:MAG: hypothetical protein HQL58_12720 [Magnetococcales bacterium]|nr:hypothetical protein [Magnetococcales bacterium]